MYLSFRLFNLALFNEHIRSFKFTIVPLRCVIPVVYVTNEREENVVKQHN